METNFSNTGLPCPCGNSSDAFCVNSDNSGKCFSCGDFFPDLSKEEYEVKKTKGRRKIAQAVRTPQEEGEVEYKYLSHRGISANTFEHYRVRVKLVDQIVNSVAFRYPLGSMKVMSFIIPKGENGHWVIQSPDGVRMRDEGLFGSNIFEKGSRESVIVTEGEYDALAAYEMLGGKFAAVSIKSAATAKTDLSGKDRSMLEYLNSFKKIYLCFDNDSPGKNAVENCISLFDFDKLYKVELSKYKDANDYLEAGKQEDFKNAVLGAKKHSPEAIISDFGSISQAIKTRAAKPIAEYPFPELQSALRGLHDGELVVIKGKQGIGKTEICRAIIHHALKTSDTKMATIFLEEDVGTTAKGVATYQLLMPCMRDDSGLSDEEILEGYREAVSNDESRLFIHKHLTGEDESEIIDNIRFLVTVAGCKVIFLDNLTMLNTGKEGEDERMRIDRITRRLRNLINELQFCLVLIAHTNDDGTTRGSRLPDIVANTVITLEREIPSVKLTFDVKKARFQGAQTGPASFGLYDKDKYILRAPLEGEDPDVGSAGIEGPKEERDTRTPVVFTLESELEPI